MNFRLLRIFSSCSSIHPSIHLSFHHPCIHPSFLPSIHPRKKRVRFGKGLIQVSSYSLALRPPGNCSNPVFSYSICKWSSGLSMACISGLFLATKGLTDVEAHSKLPLPTCVTWDFQYSSRFHACPFRFAETHHSTNNSFHINASLEALKPPNKILMSKKNAHHPFWCKSNWLPSYIKDSYHLNGEAILIIDDCFMNMKIIYSLHNQPFNWHIIAAPVECVEQIWNHVSDCSNSSFRKQEACYSAQGIRK